MTTTVASILSRATTLLQDASNIRWTSAELVDWLNEGQRALVALKPTAYVKVTSMALAAGTRQTLPSDAAALLDIPRNMGTSGTAPGRAVRMVSREMMDSYNPDWHAGVSAVAVQNWMYNAFEPKTFYVYPPSTGTGYVEVVYGAVPPILTSADNLTVDDVYSPAILNYMLYRAYAKDAEFAASGAIAQGYYAQFEASVTGKQAAELGANPQQAMGPNNPGNPGSDK